MNVFLTTLSTLPKLDTPSKAKFRYYDDKKNSEERYYYYYLQQMPGFEYAHGYLEGNKFFEKIMVVCSSQILTKVPEDDKENVEKAIYKGQNCSDEINVYNLFKNTIVRGIRYGDDSKSLEPMYTDEYDDDHFVKIDVSSDASSDNKVEGRAKIIIEKLFEFEGDIDLYIDVQGGSRTDMIVNQALLTIINNDNNKISQKIKIKKIIANQGNKQDGFSYYDATNEYKIFNLVSGMQAFSKYGKADLLKSYYDNDDSDKTSIIKAMDAFDEAISLSNAEKIFEAAKELQKKLTNNDIKDDLFKTLLSVPKRHYNEIISSKNDDELLLSIIEWCTNKGYLQQALTLYEARMTDVLLNHFNKNRVEDSQFNWSSLLVSGEKEEIEKFKQEIDKNFNCPSWGMETSFIAGGKHFKVKKEQDVCHIFDAKRKKEFLHDWREGRPKDFEKFKNAIIYGKYKELFYEVHNIPIFEKDGEKCEKCKIIEGILDKHEKNAHIYYLGIKIVRNMINHAVSTIDDDVQKAVKIYYEKFGLNLGLNEGKVEIPSKEKVEDLLSEAVAKMKEILLKS